MNRINQENLKSYILVTLIITSLIQIGIIWNYQYQNIPITVVSSFFSGLFNRSPQIQPVEADEYLRPYRIIASEGSDESHWAIYKNNEIYDALWKDLKTYYLQGILSSNPVQSYTADQWGSIIAAKSFIFEYKSNINYELFTGFLGVKDITSNRPSGIYKILVAPWEDVNYNLTVYIMDDTRIYKYIIPINDKGLSRDADSNSYQRILKRLEENGNLRDYKFIQELITGKSPIQTRPDILCVARGSKDSKYSSLKNIAISIPDWFAAKGKNDLDEIAQYVLGNERDNYDSSWDNNNSIVFRNSNNIFKLNSNGVMEYKYLSSPEGSGKGTVYETFKRAKEFVGQRRGLISGLDIYLSGVSVNTENKELFDFTFDYAAGDMPLAFNYDSKEVGGKLLKNAISITSDGNRIINCRWVLRSAIAGKDTGLYNINFEDFWNEIRKQSKADNKSISIKDINVGYEVESGTEANLAPVWIITSEEGDSLPVQMHKK